uniref:DnaJ heat shock protein family (Hsp40) member C8 n=1 Tax=Molossus molossus TaxID=27622 RepID=A0A7J8F7F1_MOLMO|nr:DnaJ heat shock protein family (Hsp40) member C8 [Molossus molossus]
MMLTEHKRLLKLWTKLTSCYWIRNKRRGPWM